MKMIFIIQCTYKHKPRSMGDHLVRKPLRTTESENPLLAFMSEMRTKNPGKGRFSHYRYSHHHFFPQMEKVRGGEFSFFNCNSSGPLI